MIIVDPVTMSLLKQAGTKLVSMAAESLVDEGVSWVTKKVFSGVDDADNIARRFINRQTSAWAGYF